MYICIPAGAYFEETADGKHTLLMVGFASWIKLSSACIEFSPLMIRIGSATGGGPVILKYRHRDDRASGI